jgi:hypothetical protein
LRALFGVLSLCFLVLGSAAVTVPWVAADASAVVQNDSMWIDSLGRAHVVGEVNNTGDVWLRFVKITGTLRDPTDAIIDVIMAYTLLSYVPPNAVAPFDMVETNTAKSARVQSYSLTVEFKEVEALSQKLFFFNVADSKNKLGMLEVVGEVENQGDTPSIYTRIIGTFYDTNGKVIYVASEYTSPDEIPVGGRNEFKITVGSSERTTRVARYSLMAESADSGFTSVPEFPWPMVVMIAALTLSIVVFRNGSRLGEKTNELACSRSAGHLTPFAQHTAISRN